MGRYQHSALRRQRTSPLTSLLIPSGQHSLHGDREITRAPLREESAEASNQRPKCWKTIPENHYSSPTTSHPEQDFPYSFPKRWAVSICLTTNKTHRLSLLYLKQLTKPQAHSTYLSSLHSHHFSPWQACFFSDAILQIIKHSMFGSDLKPLLGFFAFFP